mgnify:CR=1 FL=1
MSAGTIALVAIGGHVALSLLGAGAYLLATRVGLLVAEKAPPVAAKQPADEPTVALLSLKV